jgi:hypothetical protein
MNIDVGASLALYGVIALILVLVVVGIAWFVRRRR